MFVYSLVEEHRKILFRYFSDNSPFLLGDVKRIFLKKKAYIVAPGYLSIIIPTPCKKNQHHKSKKKCL